MRRQNCFIISLAIAMLAAVPAVFAQDEASPPGDLALPPPIPPLPAKVQDEQFEPTVRIITNEEDELIEEYSSSGRVYMVKVTPAHGVPYYYMDLDGDGELELQDPDNSFSPVKPVVWKVKEW
jgi:hypothetical protein